MSIEPKNIEVDFNTVILDDDLNPIKEPVYDKEVVQQARCPSCGGIVVFGKKTGSKDQTVGMVVRGVLSNLTEKQKKDLTPDQKEDLYYLSVRIGMTMRENRALELTKDEVKFIDSAVTERYEPAQIAGVRKVLFPGEEKETKTKETRKRVTKR